MGFSEDCSLFLAENFYSLRGSPYITVTGFIGKMQGINRKKRNFNERGFSFISYFEK